MTFLAINNVFSKISAIVSGLSFPRNVNKAFYKQYSLEFIIVRKILAIQSIW